MCTIDHARIGEGGDNSVEQTPSYSLHRCNHKHFRPWDDPSSYSAQALYYTVGASYMYSARCAGGGS